MTDDHTQPPFHDRLEAGHLVYGAVLADDLSIVESLDRDAYEDDGEFALATAVTSVSSDLVPFVVDAEDDHDVSVPAAADLDRLTDRESLLEAVADARAYYLLVDTGDDEWRRIRNVVPGNADADDPVTELEACRYYLSAALVDDATDRIGDLPSSVTGTDIELVEWSG